MEMRIGFPGGMRVDVAFAEHTVCTDQPRSAGGDGSAPSPFDLFVASIGACVGYYVLAFCSRREIPVDGIDLALHTEAPPDGKGVARILVDIGLPESFPERYVDACVRAAEQCTVKRHLESPPEIVLRPLRPGPGSGC
ncbi:MAG: OsmC family protein [Candidatus Bipolaricaulota bacterium]|nr:MAG: OsmC family protein [Candidatus Bipolaricaulota bacterium]